MIWSKVKKIYIFLALLLLASIVVHAQEDIQSSDNNQESSYESELNKNSGPTLKAIPTENAQDVKPEKIEKLSELGNLVPFSDIAVIQKRFLPKTNRFEVFPNMGLVTNNAFFMSAFLQARFGYSFSERLALEATGSFFTNSKYKVTKDLKDKLNVDTESHLLTKSYYGVDLRWSPIYGKMGVFSNGILPFDMYFSLGGGVMKTNQDTTPFAFHLGTGQIFAMKKWMAFRWDLSGYFYSSDTRVSSGGTATNHESFQDIQLSVGLSFFFPEAKYR